MEIEVNIRPQQLILVGRFVDRLVHVHVVFRLRLVGHVFQLVMRNWAACLGNHVRGCSLYSSRDHPFAAERIVNFIGPFKAFLRFFEAIGRVLLSCAASSWNNFFICGGLLSLVVLGGTLLILNWYHICWKLFHFNVGIILANFQLQLRSFEGPVRRLRSWDNNLRSVFCWWKSWRNGRWLS